VRYTYHLNSCFYHIIQRTESLTEVKDEKEWASPQTDQMEPSGI